MMSKADDKTNTGGATAARKKKLGRGLGALMGDVHREEPLVRINPNPEAQAQLASTDPVAASDISDNDLKSLQISSISPLPDQPRTHFDEGALEELAASIEARGVIQPIIVRPLSNGNYQLVAGERRWRAAQKARLHEIPALVRELSDTEVTALALIENLQREDLNPVEEARAYHRLSEEQGMTQADIAKMVDKSRSHVANFQRLLALPDDVLGFVAAGELTMGHARALIGKDNASSLAKRVVKDKLSVRDIEKLARKGSDPSKLAQDKPRAPTTRPENADIAAVQAHLEEFLGLSVRIKADADPRTGAVTIRYRTLDQLDLICQRLTGGDI